VGLKKDPNGKVEVNLGQSLEIDEEGEIEVPEGGGGPSAVWELVTIATGDPKTLDPANALISLLVSSSGEATLPDGEAGQEVTLRRVSNSVSTCRINGTFLGNGNGVSGTLDSAYVDLNEDDTGLPVSQVTLRWNADEERWIPTISIFCAFEFVSD
jgi:hypothetical protein